jgi:CheY-like chemotaxis protein
MTMPMGLEILLVEDNEGDIEMTRRAFQGHRPACNVSVANDGVAAIEFLSRQGAHADAPSPRMILLDLNMPRMDGRETLAAIKNDEELKAIPVVILTTSGATPDIVSSYQHRANAYVTKPFGLDDFEATVQQIDRFYREVATLPSDGPA